jgi:type IV pilus assembly protein PilV
VIQENVEAIMKSFRINQKGSMLLEVLIAILIFSFGILGIVGLQAASIKSVSDSKYRTDASFLANELVGRMWADRTAVVAGYGAPADWLAHVAATLPGGTGSVVVAADPNLGTSLSATVKVQWTLPGEPQHTFVSVTSINGAGSI